MRRRIAGTGLVLAALLGGGLAPGAQAQRIPQAREGARVSVQTPTARYTGTLLFVSPDSLVVQPPGPYPPVAIPRERVVYAVQSHGRTGPTVVRRLLEGTGLGLLVGGLYSVAFSEILWSADPHYVIPIGALVGLGMGVYASANEPRRPERWQPVRLPSLIPTPLPGVVPSLETCVVSSGALVRIRVQVDPATADTTFQGRRFRDAFPTTAEYAGGAAWYHENEPLPESVRPRDGGRGRYVKLGEPVTAAPDSLVRVGEHRGVPVYARGVDGRVREGTLYVPVRPGCRFQRYDFEGVGDVAGG